MDERTAIVNIGGQEYEMLLTTRATKAIAGRYGGLEKRKILRWLWTRSCG